MASKTNKRHKSFGNDTLITSIAMLAVGIIFTFFPESSGTIICYLTGSVLCAWGLLKLIMHFKSESNEAFSSYGLVISVVLIVAGITVLVRPAFFADVMVIFFGCVIGVDGLQKLQYGLDLLKIKAKYWWVVLILSGVLLGLCALVVFNPLFSVKVLIIFTGISLIFNSVSDLLVALYIKKLLKALGEKKKMIDA